MSSSVECLKQITIFLRQRTDKAVMNVWTEADASLIQWGEKDACMLSCHNITRYK